MDRHEHPVMPDAEPAPRHPESICPRCGQPLVYVAQNLEAEHVYECPLDGRFVLSRERGLQDSGGTS
jgi:CheY-like chemotaxis protein